MTMTFPSWAQMQGGPEAGAPSRITFLCAIAAVPFLSFATPVGSAEVLGDLSFEFDGATTRWQTVTREARGKIRSSATLSKGNLVDQFEVTAYPLQSNSKERFNISLVFGHAMGALTKANYDRPTDVSIVRLLGGITGPLWEARDIEISYSLDVTSEEEGRASGEFTATFCYQESLYDDADESSCETGSGSFETRFRIERDE